MERKPPTPTRNPPAQATPLSSSATTSSLKKTRSGKSQRGRRVVIYGTGGIGKTSLAAGLSDIGMNPIFIDLDGGTADMDVETIEPQDGEWSFGAIRAALMSDLVNPHDTIVIDTLTEAERLAMRSVLETQRTSDGSAATSIESYGYGKGYRFLCDTMTTLLADLDRIRATGKHVILICHDCKAEVTNPGGENYLRFEPNLYHAKSGTSSIRDMVKGWCDELLFIGYDIFTKDGKARAGSTRQIYCQEQGIFVAKSRKLEGPYSYTRGETQIWKHLFDKE